MFFNQRELCNKEYRQCMFDRVVGAYKVCFDIVDLLPLMKNNRYSFPHCRSSSQVMVQKVRNTL